MGAQGLDHSAPGFSEFAKKSDGPVHGASVEAFFLSRYELNQAQRQRLAGSTPSALAAADPGAELDLYPIDRVG